MPADDLDELVAVPDLTHGGWYVYCPAQDVGPIAWFPTQQRATDWIHYIKRREALWMAQPEPSTTTSSGTRPGS